MSTKLPAGVVRLQTLAEREAEAKSRTTEIRHAKALEMLEQMQAFARDHKIEAIAFAFVCADGSYGRIMPTGDVDAARLIGAVGTMHHDLILRTLVPTEPEPGA